MSSFPVYIASQSIGLGSSIYSWWQSRKEPAHPQPYPRGSAIKKIAVGALTAGTCLCTSLLAGKIISLSSGNFKSHELDGLPPKVSLIINSSSLVFGTLCKIYEESIMRGKLLPHHIKRHSVSTAILLNGLLCGLSSCAMSTPNSGLPEITHEFATATMMGINCATLATLTGDLWASTSSSIVYNLLAKTGSVLRYL